MKLREGDVAVVTGASGGIGRAVAERLAQEGLRIVLADIDGPRVAEVADELRAAGATVMHAVVDVTRPEQMDALRDRALEEFGSVHVVMNNAGAVAHGWAWELSYETWRKVVDVNLHGVVNGLRSFLPVLIAQKRGHVVNTASMGGLVAKPMLSPYIATKFAVAGLTEALFYELSEVAPEVGVSLLCPGPVSTEFLNPERLVSDSGGGVGAGRAADERATRTYRLTVELGMKPTEVAERVVEAIRDDCFYIITHPHKKSEVATRADDIVNGRPPTFHQIQA
jgi:NAD(P)-dependent dehydrogenase (short-subunit alcohol dehydrogenase family)